MTLEQCLSLDDWEKKRVMAMWIVRNMRGTFTRQEYLEKTKDEYPGISDKLKIEALHEIADAGIVGFGELQPGVAAYELTLRGMPGQGNPSGIVRAAQAPPGIHV